MKNGIFSKNFLPHVVVALIVLAAISAHGQNSVLTLEDATNTAIQQNPQTRMAEGGVRMAEAMLAEAKTTKKPFVQFTQNVIRSNNPVFVFGSRLEQGRFGAENFAINALNHPSAENNFRSVLSVNYSLFDQRQTESRVRQATLGKSEAELQTETARQQMRFGVIRQFYASIISGEQVKVIDSAIRSAEANRKKARDMADVGMTTEADFLAAEVELANNTQLKLEAESARITSLAALNIMLGDKPEAERDLRAEFTEKYFPVETQNDLIKLAFENRADYRRAQLAVERSKEKSLSVKNSTLPRVDAFANVGYSAPYIWNGSSDYTVGVSLTYTIFDAGKKARETQAAVGETLSVNEKEILENQIRLEVIRAYQHHVTARERIQVSVKAITQAEEVLRIANDRYKFGLTTFNEVLRAEAALVRAKQNLINARHDHYISYAEILLATGRLTDVKAFE